MARFRSSQQGPLDALRQQLAGLGLSSGTVQSRYIKYTILVACLALVGYQTSRLLAFRGDSLASYARSRIHRRCSGVCVEVNLHKTYPMSPDMYGIFYEEINHSGEGGLYPELICDRSFDAAMHAATAPQDAADGGTAGATGGSGGSEGAPEPRRSSTPLQHLSMDPDTVARAKLRDHQAWETFGTAQMTTLRLENGHNAVRVASSAFGQLVNKGHSLEGFFVRENVKYTLVMVYRLTEGAVQDFEVLLTSPAGDKVYAKQWIGHNISREWVRKAYTLVPTKDDRQTRLAIRFKGPGTLEFDYVSLMQASHYAADGSLPKPFVPGVLQVLKALRPRFLRFPGGAFVEGADLASAYRWKQTVGPHEERPGHPNANWGYWSTDGLGVFELLTLAEELGAEPLLVANIGISQSESVAPSELGPWLQDVLDLIQFVTGDATTQWGAVRSTMGRRKPWPLRYLTLGNEGCLRPWYAQHYAAVAKAVRAEHPELTLIANCDLGSGYDFDLWEFHTYRDPEPLWDVGRALDQHNGPPVAITEFAAMKGGETILAAVAEAGLMAAMERNCHKVRLASYAPLLGHFKLRNWKPDLVVFEAIDTGNVYGTPSYYTQQLFIKYSGPHCIATQTWFSSSVDQHVTRVDSSATCLDQQCHQVAVKIVNFSNEAKDVTVYFLQQVPFRSTSKLLLSPLAAKTTLSGQADWDQNSFGVLKVSPQVVQIEVQERTQLELPAFSLTVVVVEFIEKQ